MGIQALGTVGKVVSEMGQEVGLVAKNIMPKVNMASEDMFVSSRAAEKPTGFIGKIQTFFSRYFIQPLQWLLRKLGIIAEKPVSAEKASGIQHEIGGIDEGIHKASTERVPHSETANHTKRSEAIVADIHAPRAGDTALHTAIRKGHSTEIRELISKGVDLNLPNEAGETALHLACEHGNQTAVNLLLEKGASPTLQTHAGNSAVHIAAQQGHMDMLPLLKQHKADLNALNANGQSAAHIAIAKQDQAFIEALAEHKADFNLKNTARQTPLELSILGGRNPKITQTLLEKGADVNGLTSDGSSPLMLSLRENKPELTSVLLNSRTINSDMLNEALSIAARKDYAGLITSFKEAGADLNAINEAGESALHLAARNAGEGTCEELIKNDADPLLPNRAGDTAYHTAAKFNNTAGMEGMLKYEGKELKPNTFNKAGKTPAQISIENQDPATLKALLEDDKVDVNTIAKNSKDSLLNLAIQSGNRETIDAVLAKNPNVRIKNKAGLTTMELAKKHNISPEQLEQIRKLEIDQEPALQSMASYFLGGG